MTIIYLAAFVLTTLLSFLLTRSVRSVAVSKGWLFAPEAGRHVHSESVPRLGGVAIFLSFVTVTALLVAISISFHLNTGLSNNILYVLFPGTLIFMLGLYDDFRPVNPYVKFTVQALAGALLFFGGFKVFQLPLLFGEQIFGWIALPLTILWVLWITNAFNLIDGIDGLAAGSALFSTITVFVVSLVSANTSISLLAVVLAGAILGFLRFNFNPATIFLGDCGSLFIGFMLSALALAGAQKTPTIIAVAIPVVSFGLPILETTISVLRRWISGQPLFGADREHIHHMLLDRGLSQRQVVIILYGVSAVFGLLSLFLLYPGGATLGIVLFVLGAGIWLGVQRLGYHEFFELSRVAQRTIEQKRIIINNLALRRAERELAKVETLVDLRRVLDQAFRSGDFDGYELRIDPLFIDITLVDSGGRAIDERGEQLLITWRKPGGEPCEQSIWSLTLDLTSAAQKLGSFSLYRAYSDRSLMVDVNLLISGFQVALTEALRRTINNATLHLHELQKKPDKRMAAGALLEPDEQSADAGIRSL
jgi:UDP-GlcNAc:undecaprenyl-phosphate GlcNAc-1-phosphate transferase